MAIYHPNPVSCPCGNQFEANLAQSVNVARAPDVREKILAGTFHRLNCPKCGQRFTVERPFYYTDPVRNAIFLVHPRSKRFLFRQHSRGLAQNAGSLPAVLSPSGPAAKDRQLRVVYGMDELREKLVAQDAGLDDRIVELLKILVVYEHPFLLQKTRLQLFLTQSDAGKLVFSAYHHNAAGAYHVTVPKGIADNIASRATELQRWADKAHRQSLFKLDTEQDSWVSMRRWTTRYTPLEQLQQMADSLRAGKEVDLTSDTFNRMVDRLPRGNQLPGWAKQALRDVFLYAKKCGKDAVEDRILEIRFGLELDDEWAHNSDPDDIDTIWQLLRDVPITNIEGNTKLLEIKATTGDGGLYQRSGVIEVGEDLLKNKEAFEDVLRHEVGHSVHAQLDAKITPWLQERFGWRFFDNTAAGINGWVQLMGGWGDLTPQQISEVTHFLSTAAGPGASWNPGPAPNPPANHPWRRANFGPRLAFEKTGANWYNQYGSWHRANGLAFFVNYWYAWFMVVKEETLDEFVAKMPDAYAAMSHFEFFAELYALYYDKDDPQRKVIPPDVGDWLNRNVGVWDASNPRRPRGPGPAAHQ